jgi:hypothetical protein
MLAVRLCGPRVVERLESIGVRRLSDLVRRTPDELVTEVNIEAGRPIWHPPMATRAMSNLIAAAEAERSRPSDAHEGGADSCLVIPPSLGEVGVLVGSPTTDRSPSARPQGRWVCCPRVNGDLACCALSTPSRRAGMLSVGWERQLSPAARLRKDESGPRRPRIGTLASATDCGSVRASYVALVPSFSTICCAYHPGQGASVPWRV